MSTSDNKQAFISWGDSEEDKRAVIDAYLSAVDSSALVVGRDRFLNYDSNTSVREGFNRHDYEYFRESEQLPRTPKDSMKLCDLAYYKVGLIRNVIDLMGDFASQGVRILHPVRSIERFYQEWARRINMQAVSERLLNQLYRLGNVVLYRQFAKLTPKQSQHMRSVHAEIKAREIPWKYTFLNPLTIEALDTELGIFSSKFRYAIKVDTSTLSRLKAGMKNLKEDTTDLPRSLLNAINASKTGHIELDPDKVVVFNYKKDDWQVWAFPMLNSLLDDIMYLEKMRLADLAALDGAISHIRLWKLGSLEHKILPTQHAIAKLNEMLLSSVGGGSMDIIWGPDLELEETGTEIYRFLGSEKYEFVLTNLYTGLGIPPTLTGASNSSGFTNNYISLKTMMERLNYGRNVLKHFWQNEVRLIQKAMGFSKPPYITFDRMVLTDEAAEKQLLISLAERNLISVESVQERFGEIPEIEAIRMLREDKRRNVGKFPRKAGPWHNPEHKESLEKIFVQQGLLSPSQVGLEYEEKKSGEITLLDYKQQLNEEKLSGIPGQGRPKNSRDTEKRKRREPKIRTSAEFASLAVWARDVQNKINDIMTPVFLTQYGCSNLRQLTNEQTEISESIKFAILSQLEPYQMVTVETLQPILEAPFSNYLVYNSLREKFIDNFRKTVHKSPTFEEMRQINAIVYGVLNTGEDNG